MVHNYRIVYLKTDGTTTGHPSRSWRPYRRPDVEMRRTTGQQLLPINESLVVGATGQT